MSERKTSPAGGPALDARADADFVELLREHASLRRRLIQALHRRGKGAPASDDGVATETEASDLVLSVAIHLEGIVDEATRRGDSPANVQAWFALAAPDLVRLDYGAAFAAGLTEGLDGAEFRGWRARARAGSAAAGHVAGVASLSLAKSKAAADEGLKLIEAAAAAGSANALVELGAHEIDVDPRRAVTIFRKAAEAGNAVAYARLAGLAAAGRVPGVAVGEVIEWLGRAAESGDAEARLELGRIKATGAFGLPIDFGEARKWLSFAAKQHRGVAKEWIEKYGSMDAESYRSAAWIESWTPTSLPAPPRTRSIGLVLSVSLLLLLVIGAIQGSSLGLFLLFSFFAILMHETGHFLAARMAGIPIAVFTVGTGPVVRSFAAKSGRLPMRVDLRVLPLMGSVQPYVAPRAVWLHWQQTAQREGLGEPPPAPPKYDENDEPGPVFLHVSKGRRLAFLAGGLAVNFAAAVAFFWIYEQRSPVARLVTVPEAGHVAPGSVAAAAGLREDDRFIAIDGVPVAGFFDVSRRLAPMDDSGAATHLADPPGREVRLDVRRGGTEMTLTWTTPTAPPPGDAAIAYGLVPPESWQIGRVRQDIAADLRVDDEVVSFVADGKEVARDAVGARAALRDALVQGAVELRIRRGDQSLTRRVEPWRPASGDAARAPFEFARRREPGDPAGLPEVLGRVVRVGWRSIVALPTTMVQSLKSTPSREERGWLAAAVKRDPWQAADLFGWIHAFLLFLNLVPIPPLDGFQLAALGVESAARRPLPRRGAAVIRKIGFVILGLWLAVNAFLILRDALAAVF